MCSQNNVFLFFFSDKRPEQSIASARASVMIYDDLNKKWVPSGTSHGLSKVHIYHHFINNTFRVVGRKLQDHEVRTKNQARYIRVDQFFQVSLHCVEFFILIPKMVFFLL